MEIKYKRFIVFGWDQYYPSGGLEDCMGDFDTLEEIEKCITKDDFGYMFNGFNRDHYSIFDCQERMQLTDLPNVKNFIGFNL
jgi:hypothetical protein